MKVWGIIQICIAVALVGIGIISLVKGIVPTGGIIFFLIAIYLFYVGFRDVKHAKKQNK